MNQTVQYVPVEEITVEAPFRKAIGFKPKRAPLFCMILGVLLLIPNNLIVRLLGLFFIAMGLLVLLKVKDYKVMDLFDTGVMVYGDRGKRTACFLPFEDLKEWEVSHESGHDTIEFVMNDGRIVVKDSFEADSAYRVLYQLAREKERRYLQAQKDREKPLSIPDALANIRKSFTKKK